MYMDNLSYFYSPPQSSPPLQRTSDPGQPDRSPWSRPGNCSTPNPVKIEWYRPINMHSVWLNIIHCLKNKEIQSWYNWYIIHICVCVLSVFCIMDFVVFSEALPLAPCLIKWLASPTSSCKMDEWRNLKSIQKKIENPKKWSTQKKIENPKKWSTFNDLEKLAFINHVKWNLKGNMI